MLILEDQIGFNVYRVALLFRRELLHALKEYQLTPEQWQILVTLWNNGTITQSQIISITLQDAPSVSRTIERLIRKGLIVKVSSKKDKRSHFLKLTKTGLNLKEKLPEIVTDHFKSLLDSIPQKDQESFMLTLKNLRKAFGDTI